MQSIRNLTIKIKQIAENKDIYTVLIIILAALSSFGLGRLSKIEEVKVPVSIEMSKQQASIGSALTYKDTQSGEVVASKNGAKYHLPWCSGAKRISEQNKIWFKNSGEAERSGYMPAKNCKGL